VKSKNALGLKDTVAALRADASHGLYVMHQQDTSIAVLCESLWLECWAADGTDTEVVRFACEGKNNEDLLQSLGDQDLFGGPKVYLVRDCEKLLVKSKELNLPEPGRYLFFYKGRAAPSWLQKWSKSLGVSILKSKAPETRAFTEWAGELFTTLGFAFTTVQSKKLMQYYQENVADLIQLLGKLSLFKDEQGKVSESDLDTFLQAQPAQHFFTLSNLLLDLKFAEASHFVRTLRQKGESEYAVMGFLASFLRRAVIVAESGPTVKSVPSVPPFLMRKYRGFATRVGINRLTSSIRMLAFFDVHWKSAQGSPSIDLDNLLFGMS